jgi:hypothetical protein
MHERALPLSFLILLLVGAVGACAGDDAMSSDTVSPTTGAADGTSSTSAMDASESLTSTGPGDGTGSSSSTGVGEGSTASDTDTGPGPGVEPPCGFGPTLCMLATGKTEPIDCGTITLADGDDAWQAASTCAVAAATGQEAFKVAFQQPSDDSLIFDGYYGTVGVVYGVGRLYTDTFGDPMLGVRGCTDVAAMTNCEPGVAQHCLQCVDEGEIMPLECAMQ